MHQTFSTDIFTAALEDRFNSSGNRRWCFLFGEISSFESKMLNHSFSKSDAVTVLRPVTQRCFWRDWWRIQMAVHGKSRTTECCVQGNVDGPRSFTAAGGDGRGSGAARSSYSRSS